MNTIFTKFIVTLTTFTSYLLTAQTYNYTWMKGAPSSSSAVYGTLGVASSSNNPGNQSNGITWTDQSGNLWLYGGYGSTNTSFGYLNDLWKYSPGTNSWTWVNGSGFVAQAPTYGVLGVSSASANPGGRNSAAAWADASGNLWLFGGMVNGSIYNDLWRYTISNNQWTWMGGSTTPSQTAVYGSMTVPSATNIPGASYDFVSWKDASGNFWMYDAVDGTEIWKYNPSTAQWAWMNGTNTGTVTPVFGTMGVSSSSVHPGERWTQGVADASGNLYVFGGKVYTSTGTRGRNDLWKYTISNNQWTWIGGSQSTNSAPSYGTQGVFSSTNLPYGRYGHVLWLDNNNKVWVFGGEYQTLTGIYWLNDTWCFDITTGQWAWMKGNNTSFTWSSSGSGAVYGTQTVPATANTPGWRVSAPYWPADPAALWIFSGMEWIGSNELWKFNGCSSTSTISISSSHATLCAGATATLTASGSAGTYSWNTGAQTSTIAVSPSSTTAYYAMGSGTANCSTAGGFTLTVQSQTISILSSQGVLCSGQSVSLTASGAQTFTWNSGQTGPVLVVAPLATTVYSVSAANGCTSSASYTQIVNPNPVLTITSSPPVTCSGDPVLLNVTGAVNYSWNNGQMAASFSTSPLSTTVYTVTGTTNGCSTTGSFTQQVLPLPTIYINGPANTICIGETVLLTAMGANTYTWSLQGLNSPVIQVSPPLATSYTVTGTNNNGCEGAAAVTVNVLNCIGLGDFNGEENSFSVFPNPASTLFTIRGTAGEVLKVINSFGQSVLEEKLESEAVVIDGRLSPGIYYCIISGITKTVKLVIQD